MKQILILTFFTLCLVFGQAQSWELVVEGAEFRIEQAHVVCKSNQGFDYDYIVLKFTNLTADVVTLTYNYEEWYNDVCKTCTDQDMGSKRTLQLAPNEVKEGNCNSNSLKIFDHSITVHPNAFSPNGDALNARFFPVNLDVNSSISAFRVYNRWGDLVYEYNNDLGWDGSWNGQSQPEDVYNYYLVIDKSSENLVLSEQ